MRRGGDDGARARREAWRLSVGFEKSFKNSETRSTPVASKRSSSLRSSQWRLMRFRLTLREKNTAERSPSLLERQANCAERRGCQGCEAPPSAAARDLSRAAL